MFPDNRPVGIVHRLVGIVGDGATHSTTGIGLEALRRRIIRPLVLGAAPFARDSVGTCRLNVVVRPEKRVA